jgi:GNAT superfamily N-acetyltransferase
VSLFLESEDKNFGSAWRHKSPQSLGIFYKKDLVGFALLNSRKLSFIGVHPLFQAYGLGSRLLKAVLYSAFSAYKNVYLTPVSDDDVIRWYVKHGFTLIRCTESDTPGVPYLVYNAHRYPTRSKDQTRSKDPTRSTDQTRSKDQTRSRN